MSEVISAIVLIVMLVVSWGFMIWMRKRKEILHFVKKRQAEKIQAETESLCIRSDEFCEMNTFTEMMAGVFDSDNWLISTSEKTAEFRVRNPFGDIFGLAIHCSVLRNNIPMCQFSEVIPRVEASEDIYFKETISKAFPEKKDLKRVLGLKKDWYTVVFKDYEFYLPETNDLYYSEEVRRAVGAKLIERKATPYEEFLQLKETLPSEMETYADETKNNIDKAIALVIDHPEMQDQVERFTDKYIPLANDMIQNYNLQDEAGRNAEELGHTLRILASGSRKFVQKMLAEDEQDSYVAKVTIEQELLEDGLYDPSMEVIDKWKQ